MSYTTIPMFWCFSCNKRVSITYKENGAVCYECGGKNVVSLPKGKFNPSRRLRTWLYSKLK